MYWHCGFESAIDFITVDSCSLNDLWSYVDTILRSYSRAYFFIFHTLEASLLAIGRG